MEMEWMIETEKNAECIKGKRKPILLENGQPSTGSAFIMDSHILGCTPPYLFCAGCIESICQLLCMLLRVIYEKGFGDGLQYT
jgi:hypothetical protein